MGSRDLTFQLFLSLTLIGSIVWLDLLVHLVLSCVALYKVLTGLPDLLNGMTIIAIGNTIPDVFVTQALCKYGYVLMACTGIFSGIIFNLLLGYSAATLLKTIK